MARDDAVVVELTAEGASQLVGCKVACPGVE